MILIFLLVIGYMKTFFALRTDQQIDAQLILGYYLMKLLQQFFDCGGEPHDADR